MRKFHIPGKCVLITTRIEEGILLPPTPVMQTVIMGHLARAHFHYPVSLVAFVVMGNHLHIILFIQCPDHVDKFVGRIKTEISHAINRMLGRKKRTVWCESYHSPPLWRVEDVVKEIAYVYANPAMAGLVDKIEDYPGLSSWGMLESGKHTREYAWIRRTQIERVRGPLRKCHNQCKAEVLIDDADEWHEFKIEPDLWMESYGITTEEEKEKVRKDIIARVREMEEEARSERLKKGKGVVGRERLLRMNFDLYYKPKKWGKKMWIVCGDKKLRKRVLSYLKDLARTAREVYQMWKRGDFSVPFPSGLYPPSMPKQSEMVPAVTLAGAGIL